jgi:hypothetical protein
MEGFTKSRKARPLMEDQHRALHGSFPASSQPAITGSTGFYTMAHIVERCLSNTESAGSLPILTASNATGFSTDR